VALFVGAFCIILSMYGGGFATDAGLPSRHVRHAAWSARSWAPAHRVVGGRHRRPGDRDYLRDYQLARGVRRPRSTTSSPTYCAGCWRSACLCNCWCAGGDKHFMTEAELDAERSS
jgi:hypothetical protein